MTKFKTLRVDKLFSGPAFEIERRYFEDDNNFKLDRDVVLHSGAVVILPINAEGQILMLKQYRHAISDFLYELPAGTLEKGEEPLCCAKREIREETGFSAENMRSLGTLYPAPGFCNELQHGFFATELQNDPLPQDDDEYIEVAPMTYKEVLDKIKRSEILDAKTISFLFRAQLENLL